jgi:nicotinamidase-related amidase
MDRFTQPDLGSAVLLTIDVQYDVLEGQPFDLPGTTAVVPAVAELASAFRSAGRPIVHMVRLYRPDGHDVDLCRRAWVQGGAAVLVPGTPGSQLAPGVAPGAGELDPDRLLAGVPQVLDEREVVIYKPRWGAFYRTPLGEHLEALGVSTLVFCGFNFPNCPRASIFEASERDFRVALAVDAVSGFYEQAARELSGIGVALMSNQEIMAGLG